MCKVGKMILKVFAILAAIAGVVAAVYYWNLDQKLLEIGRASCRERV